MRILLIEGSTTFGNKIKTKLQSYGHTVALAHTVDAAHLLVETKPFDMIIVELSTPEESILEFLDYLQQTKSDMPVYALTAEYAISASSKDIKFDMVDVLNNSREQRSTVVAQNQAGLSAKMIQPKMFHNFCLN